MHLLMRIQKNFKSKSGKRNRQIYKLCFSILMEFFFIRFIQLTQIATMRHHEIDSKREDNWKKYPYLFNQCKNLTFQCQCGKKYVSFPGLYLHFQRKHGQKISTKINPEECQVISEDGKTTYKYMFETKRLNKDQENYAETSLGEKQHVSSVLSKFVEDSQDNLRAHQYFSTCPKIKEMMEEVIVNFENYMFQRVEQRNQNISIKTILYEIPQHFNSFMEQVKASWISLQYRQICQILFQMANWLRKQGHSQLITQFTSDPQIFV